MQLHRLAAQELSGLISERLILLYGYLSDTGRCAAFDLMQHAGARACIVDAVLARAEQKRFLQCIERAHHRTRRCEGAKIVALIAFRPRYFLIIGASWSRRMRM